MLTICTDGSALLSAKQGVSDTTDVAATLECAVTLEVLYLQVHTWPAELSGFAAKEHKQTPLDIKHSHASPGPMRMTLACG